MPSYFVTQPNGKYALFSTVVDNFIALDYSPEECYGWYFRKGLNGIQIDQQWKRVLDDVIPLREGQPCCDQKPLRRWHDCLNTILHVHGTSVLFRFLEESRYTWSTDAKSNR